MTAGVQVTVLGIVRGVLDKLMLKMEGGRHNGLDEEEFSGPGGPGGPGEMVLTVELVWGRSPQEAVAAEVVSLSTEKGIQDTSSSPGNTNMESAAGRTPECVTLLR